MNLLIAIMLATGAPQVAAAPPPPVSVDAVRMAAARRLIDVVLPPESRDATFAQMVTAHMANMTRGIIQGQGLAQTFADHPDAARVFGRFVERQRQLALADLKQATPSLIDAQVNAYARRFTADEMEAIVRFFSSTVGRKYRIESQTLTSDPAIGRWQSELAARAQARLASEVGQLMTEIRPIIDRDEKAKHASHS